MRTFAAREIRQGIMDARRNHWDVKNYGPMALSVYATDSLYRQAYSRTAKPPTNPPRGGSGVSRAR